MKNISTNLPEGDNVNRGEKYLDSTNDKVTIGILPDYAEVGDVWLYDSTTGKKFFVNPSNLSNFADERYKAIGVCYIPSSHDVYGNGSAGVLSLDYMNYTTPDTGSTSVQGIYWGLTDVNISDKLPFFSGINILTSNTGNTLSSNISLYSYLPSDQCTGPDSDDPLAKYHTDAEDYYAPSPYASDGISRNPVYYESYYDSDICNVNALSDFNGKQNTTYLCDLATSQSDWRTDTSIINNYTSGYSPAACCTWRYCPDGTKLGSWYLPSAGELGYVWARWDKINEGIIAILNIKKVGAILERNEGERDCYLSSTNNTNASSWSLDLYDGSMCDEAYLKYENDTYVRAVCSSIS